MHTMCDSSGCNSGLLPGKFDCVWPFWGVLIRSSLFQAFVGPSQHSARGRRVRGLSSLSGLPMCSSAPLTGKFGVSDVLDVFAGVFKLLTMLCISLRTVRLVPGSFGPLTPCNNDRHHSPPPVSSASRITTTPAQASMTAATNPSPDNNAATEHLPPPASS